MVHLFVEGGPPYAPEEGGDRPLQNFDGLAFAIEELMLTKGPPWPMERTVLTTGAGWPTCSARSSAAARSTRPSSQSRTNRRGGRAFKPGS